MAQSKNSGCLGTLASFWRGVDLARRTVFNLIFLALLFFLLALSMSGSGIVIPDKAALVLSPQGMIVEQLSGSATDRALDKIMDREEPEVLLQELLDTIHAAKEDDRIQAILLDLRNFSGAGLNKMQVLRAAIDDFKSSGKTVVASADSYSRNQYYLATTADEIHLHEMGMVLIDGYGRYPAYFKEGLDRLEVDWNVFKVGEYKSAVEPFIRNDMSDEAREANLDWMGDLWASYMQDVAAARQMDLAALQASVEQMPSLLKDAQGNASEMALRAGLVDQVGNRDTVRDRMIELVGKDEEGHSFNRVSFENYLESLGESRSSHGGDNVDETVAVIVARGTILDGTQPPGTIGGDSTAALIREARENEDVKALVLRVDSGGGSAFASEVIRRELALAREEGKPVVISMGSVAASGGYWIATSSDEIWASPNTVTGSIGIFGMLPTFQKPMAKYLGTRVDGVGTNWLAGAYRLDRELDPEVGELVQTLIERGYHEFLTRVGEARDMTLEEVDKIAQGRVWSGADAHALGLVDQLGGLNDAVASAANLAGLSENHHIQFVEPELDFEDRLLVELLSSVDERFPNLGSRMGHTSVGEIFLNAVEDQAGPFARFNDPFATYAYCFCEAE